MKTLTDKRKHDVVGLFLIYLVTVGDVERTALAAEVDPQVIRDLAASEKWNEKVKSLTLASKSGGMQADEFARMQNRALAWVQAHRMRQVLDRVVCDLHDKTTEELIAEVTVTDKAGRSHLNARFFSDMAKALETVNGLAFAALGDTIPERKSVAPDAAENAAAIHASLIAALNSASIKGKPSDQLVADVAQALDIESHVIQSGLPIERKALAAPPTDAGAPDSQK